MLSRFSALQHRDFRLYWFGIVIAVSGQQLLWMLEGWLLYELTGSKLLLGANAVAQSVPATILSLFGGAIADRFDQKRLLIWTQIGLMILIGLMAALALAETLQVWQILTIAFLISAVGSFEGPARHSMFPHLVDRAAMPNAIALNATIHPGTRILAPTIGGFALAGVYDSSGSALFAAGSILLITLAGILVFTLMLVKVHLPPVKRSQTGGVLHGTIEGGKFVLRNRIFAFLIGMAYFNMAFGISLSVLFPVMAKDVLGVGPSSLGIMWTSMGIGSLMGVIAGANLKAPYRQRQLLVGGSVLLGLGMLGFGFSTAYLLSLAFILVVGFGASAFNVGIQSNLQMLVPNEFRGRVMGVWGMVHTSIRPMGEMQLSAVAAAVSAPFSLLFSGVLILIFALVFVAPSRQMKTLADLRSAGSIDNH